MRQLPAAILASVARHKAHSGGSNRVPRRRSGQALSESGRAALKALEAQQGFLGPRTGLQASGLKAALCFEKGPAAGSHVSAESRQKAALEMTTCLLGKPCSFSTSFGRWLAGNAVRGGHTSQTLEGRDWGHLAERTLAETAVPRQGHQ